MLATPITWWGDDGHAIVCKIAQDRLSNEAAKAVKKLLPKSAKNDLASQCSWADHLRFIFPWSSPLHFADTPDNVCSFNNKSNNPFLFFSDKYYVNASQLKV
ncbi:unnamed protein product [Vicia faba]|uniref:Aspergillus nuclease S1 n=1 Tax=Vicia faba TaxID=3906 RepID=A0AAV0YLP2_VICFA|nr:unnamed protein product [Vicia faba]